MSHSSSPTTQQFSSTVAMFAFGRTSVVLQEQRLEICCFAEKVMDKSYSFGTHEFSPSVFSMTCHFHAWVAGLVARWQDYAVTPVSQFFIFWTHAVFPSSNPIVHTDDQALLAEKEHLQEGIFTLNKILELYNMKILENKSSHGNEWEVHSKSKKCSEWNNSGTDQRL
jgi:hypothetical protein